VAIRDQILQAANEIAGRMQADLFDFDRQLSEAKKPSLFCPQQYRRGSFALRIVPI
jgi:hypothetical protein